MRWTKLIRTGLILAVISGSMAVWNGCGGIPKGTVAQLQVGTVQLIATGAGIITANAQKTTFQIKCESCGFEPVAITIDTPVAGKPYTLDWVCPQCGHQQKIVIAVKP